jgi:phosphate starvation-inducible PhoH-like protein
MDRSIEFDSEEQMCRVCGVNDRNIPYMEMLLGCDLFVRGTSVTCRGESESGVRLFSSLVGRLKQMADRNRSLSETEIFMEYQGIKNMPSAIEASRQNDSFDTELPFISVQNKVAYPKGPRQATYIRAMERNQIVFGVGPAGTGKTFLAISYALGLLLAGKRRKLILTRPIVEAGESLGFLPGDLAQKINPYLRPLYDAMEMMVSLPNIHKLEDNGSIEVAPLAYMRGRSLHDAVIILDEAQNTTREQMQMFLTRLGENASAIITGDVSQVDLPRNKESGLVHALRILDGIEGLQIVSFDSRDVVRSRMVQRIIDAYATEQEQGQEERGLYR